METDLRVGIIHWTFSPTTGGVESHIADLSRLLSRAGCSVIVITGEPFPEQIPGVEIVSSQLLNLDRIRVLPSDEKRYSGELRTLLSGIISECKLDVVHGHNLHHFSAEPALILEELRSQLGFRIHHTFHETWPDMLRDNPVYARWDGNYAVSRFVQQQCDKRLGFRPRLFPLGVDLDLFCPSRSPFSGNQIPVILHPARLLPWKGVHLSVQMLATLHAQGIEVRLVITDTQRIADWNQELDVYRREVLNMVSTLGLAGNVEFRSARYSEMPGLYNQADIVIYPTIGEEPYGLVPLEAMSCERPVVASRSGGIAETIVDGETGFTVERGDVGALSECVRLLVNDRRRARRLGAAGRRHVYEHFDVKRYISTLIDSYDR